MELSIAQPDDWHLHLRDGELLDAVVSHRFLIYYVFFNFFFENI